MNRLMIQAALCFIVCPVFAAQQPSVASSASKAGTAVETTSDSLQTSTTSVRMQAIRSARTICINSETVFLTVSTLDRALMNQRSWEKLGLNIVNDPQGADLQIQVNRVVFTHIHTYLVTERATGIVLASGRVRALDGVLASGPMAEQIVKALAVVRLQGQTASGE